MSRAYGGRGYVDNEDAYNAAIQRRIHANARKTRERTFRAAEPELAAKLLDGAGTHAERDAMPRFIWEALNRWGALTPKQADVARNALTRATERAAARATADAARQATATPWVAGRQFVEGVIRSARVDARGVAYNVTAYALKALVETASGAKLWTSLPKDVFPRDAHGEAAELPDAFVAGLKGKRVTMTVTVEPKADDPTFAFGARPSKGTLWVAPDVWPPAPLPEAAPVLAGRIGQRELRRRNRSECE